MIVMLSGRAGEGKTTFANYCRDELQLKGSISKVFSFAQAVKDTAKLMNWDGKKDDRGRTLLQKVGAAGREYDINTWANIAVEKIQDWISTWTIDSDIWVALIDDWRFENEGNVLMETFYPVLKARIIRPKEFHLLLNTPLYNDISEIGLPEFDEKYYDVGIYNSTDLKGLKNTARQFINKLLTGENK